MTAASTFLQHRKLNWLHVCWSKIICLDVSPANRFRPKDAAPENLRRSSSDPSGRNNVSRRSSSKDGLFLRGEKTR